MKNTTRYVTFTIAAALLGSGAYFYRTLELGRADAQPAMLDILNPAGEFTGPRGIQFDAAGNIYVGDAQGIVWILDQGGRPHVYAQMSRVQSPPGAPPASGSLQVGGLVFDGLGNLYAACLGYGGGSILRIEAGTKEIRFFAWGIGVANSLVVSKDATHLWVSDCRSSGRLLRYPLGGTLPARPDAVVTGLDHPSGIAFGKEQSALYAAETYSGNIAHIDIAGEKPQIERVISLKGSFAMGSLDDLAFDPRDAERRFLYVAENMRGIFTVVDLRGRPPRAIKSFHLAQMAGRLCPASMVIHDGYLYFTDVWACSPLRILLGMPRWHNHVYRFRVLDLSSLYTTETRAAAF